MAATANQDWRTRFATIPREDLPDLMMEIDPDVRIRVYRVVQRQQIYIEQRDMADVHAAGSVEEFIRQNYGDGKYYIRIVPGGKLKGRQVTVQIGDDQTQGAVGAPKPQARYGSVGGGVDELKAEVAALKREREQDRILTAIQEGNKTIVEALRDGGGKSDTTWLQALPGLVTAVSEALRQVGGAFQNRSKFQEQLFGYLLEKIDSGPDLVDQMEGIRTAMEVMKEMSPPPPVVPMSTADGGMMAQFMSTLTQILGAGAGIGVAPATAGAGLGAAPSAGEQVKDPLVAGILDQLADRFRARIDPASMADILARGIQAAALLGKLDAVPEFVMLEQDPDGAWVRLAERFPDPLLLDPAYSDAVKRALFDKLMPETVTENSQVAQDESPDGEKGV